MRVGEEVMQVSQAPTPSKVVVTKLKLDKDHKALLDGKGKGRSAKEGKGKYSEEAVVGGPAGHGVKNFSWPRP